MKKISYAIANDDGTKEDVMGEKVGYEYGVHQRDDGYYVLTHIPSGYRVASSRLKRNILMLASDPAFFDPLNPADRNDLYKMCCAIQRHCRQYGWK